MRPLHVDVDVVVVDDQIFCFFVFCFLFFCFLFFCFFFGFELWAGSHGHDLRLASFSV